MLRIHTRTNDVNGPADWKRFDAALIAKIDIKEFYERLGASFTKERPTSSGWLECRAIGREDAKPSAAVNIKTGRYRDLAAGDSLSIFDAASKFDPARYGPTFATAKAKMAEECGLALPASPHATNGHARTRRPRRKAAPTPAPLGSDGSDGPDGSLPRPSPRADGAKAALRFVPWSDTIATLYCRKKAGVTPEAIRLAGARLTHWPARAPIHAEQLVYVIPTVTGPGDPTGHVIFRTDTRDVLIYRGEGKPPDAAKALNEGPSGLFPPQAVAAALDPSGPSTVWKLESVSDLLALLGAIPPDLRASHCVVATGGAGVDRPGWFLEGLRGKALVIVHDSDAPGQGGAGKWASAALAAGVTVYSLKLPCKDVRDFIAGGGTFADLQAMLEQSKPLDADGAAALAPEAGGEDGPRLLTADRTEGDEWGASEPWGNATVGENDRGRVVFERVELPVMAERLLSLTGGWPKVAGGRLFVDAGNKPRWLDTQNALFQWIQSELPRRGRSFTWSNLSNMATKGEFMAQLVEVCERFEAVEEFPHEPRIPGHYYLHPEPKGGDGKALGDFLDLLMPEPSTDKELLLAAVLTLFWGGPPGKRPALLIESDPAHENGGVGAGKSTTAHKLASLCGGYFANKKDDDFSKFESRLLSDGGRGRRMILLDNLKALKFSSAEIESLITSPALSGWRLYEGEGGLPNHFVWFITANDASLSRDMADRAIPFRVSRPKGDGTWDARVDDFIAKRRWEVIGDALAMLREQGAPLGTVSRWGSWELGVLAKVPGPVACQKAIAERQKAVNFDAYDRDTVREFFMEALRNAGRDPDTCACLIPSTDLARLLEAATGERRPAQRATVHLKTLRIPELTMSKRNGFRAWEWRGKDSQHPKGGRDDAFAMPLPVVRLGGVTINGMRLP